MGEHDIDELTKWYTIPLLLNSIKAYAHLYLSRCASRLKKDSFQTAFMKNWIAHLKTTWTHKQDARFKILFIISSAQKMPTFGRNMNR